MDKLINDFIGHLEQAKENFNTFSYTPKSHIHNVVVCGMGGSAYGGEISSAIANRIGKVPVFINRSYDIPAFVNEHTLILASSYSGNTEETLSAVNQAVAKGAQVIALTSGGKIGALAEENSFPILEMFSGLPPRTAAGFSLTLQLCALEKAGLLTESVIGDLDESIALLKNFDDNELTKSLASSIHNKIPIIYSADILESVAIRFRQQINENSKQLCWHHVIPEMNHNELVGWENPKVLLDNALVLLMRSNYEHKRNAARIAINKEIIEKTGVEILEIHAKGESYLAQLIYLMHFVDWVSFYLAEKNNLDPIPVKVIDYLKTSLAKID